MDEGDVSSPGQSPSIDGPGESADPEPDASQASAESSTFARCARCGKAEEVDASAGTLICTEYNMRVNAEADEIPDDCVAFTADEKDTTGG